MRGKELSDGRNVLSRHSLLACHHGIFFLGNVKLVQPAEDFHFGTVIIRNLSTESIYCGMLGEKIVGKQHPGMLAGL